MGNNTIIIVLIASVVGPCLLAFLTYWFSRSARQEDWARQDRVAAQAADAARLLLEAQQETIRRTDKVALIATERSEEIGSKLGVIHDLVNSNVTALKQSELDGTKRELVLMNRIIDIGKGMGNEPTKEELGALKATRDKILDMESELEQRQTQQEAIDKNLSAQGTSVT